MKFQHIKRTWTSPFYVNIKKHYCPDCHSLLSKTKVSKIVNSKSPEAKEYDFSSAGGEGYMFGDVKFIWTEFKCPSCGKQISISDMKKIERHIRKVGPRFKKLNAIDETVTLLEEILKEIDSECENEKSGIHSPWGLSQLEDFVRPEMEELLFYAKKGLIFYKYGEKQKMLASVYYMTDSLENLWSTRLGKKITQLKFY
ncbi:MAG: hypothetical protein HGB31_02845 [Erysipelotrichaceae bacterium]|nr:hypothetical protein [Erysipelotrichaceae bacterium]